MLFNSLMFVAFLSAVFGLYWWMGRWKSGLKAQNIFLILSGYLFYGWWDWRFLILLFVATAVDFWMGTRMWPAGASRARKWPLVVSLSMNLGMLGTFKYFDFFAQSLMDLLLKLGIQADLPLLKLILPVGISFYTFQTMSYTIDVYRGKLSATRDPVAFFAFVSFFPPLAAGPIERATHLLPQMQRPRTFSYPLAVTGLRLILWGIFKKVVIADALAPFVGYVFGGVGATTGLDVVLATVMFTVQVYCDFSGYTDVARGCARLLGFELIVNFDRPLFSASLQEFWTRWHISLNTWFRDYLYIPLGGSRKGPARQWLNVMAVFVVSGLWHGAAVTFLLWGATQGLWYSLEQWLRLPKRLPRWLMHLLTLVAVVFGFIFFRAGTTAELQHLLAALSDWSSPCLWEGISADLGQIWPMWAVLAYFGGLVLFLLVSEGLWDFANPGGRFDQLPRWTRWSYYYLVIGWLLLLGAYGTPQQFIYFQF